ncbi:AAA ATPase-like domain-containing protein [Desulfonema limicola]|uniref:AAA ATPase-like domain-containing protein n=1 Tax=Desulfonema limicola TaxID=45656 RepID=A0A975GIK5_9BACT|nr:AAA family ATPase [Desulfonema limicola]QTA82033.1 AAA ATPase-like domain-containing protein [Desulfonema limicola]
MKFPYGICDFRKITMKNYFYCDRTDRIPLLEKGEYLLFLRPRRFGKSLLLSMLANYYDVAKKHEFETMFGNLKIGKNPTELRNSFFILKWDFSCVDPSGSVEDIRKALHDHINSCIKAFCRYYRNQLPGKVNLDWDNAINSINELISIIQTTDYNIYLLIDEYDNFANQIMMGIRRERNELYDALVHEEGPLRTLFKAVKASASESIFDRIFITGVSPVVMSDITSGYNIAENIYLRYQFNDICGFTDNEIEQALKSIAGECDLSEEKITEALELMKTYYNGYKFSSKADKYVYNPTLSTYFLKYLYEDCEYPDEMLDSNLATDDAKLEYIAQVPAGRQMLLELLREDRSVDIPKLTSRFGIREMLTDQGKDNVFMKAFLYYFGVLTVSERTEQGKINLKIPNLAIKGLYADKICQMLLPEPAIRDQGKAAAELLYQQGNIQPLCDFVEQHYFKVFSNRDYKWANELTVKTAFLTLLYNDILYIMDTETELDRRYADLTMIIRPDMRRFTILDILIEFKFVKLKDADMSGEQAGKLTQEELQNMPLMKTQMEDAKVQVKDYGDVLDKRHGNLRLRKYAVVSLGFERLWWEEVIRRKS